MLCGMTAIGVGRGSISKDYSPLSGSEAKWLICMILKSYGPIQIPKEP
jgi:hypothetical protein